MECFTAFLTFLAEKRQNLAFRRPAGYSRANSSITGIFLECPNFLRLHVLGHCVKSVQVGSYFWSAFSCIRTEYGEILSNYGKIRTRNNSVFGHFSSQLMYSVSGDNDLVRFHLWWIQIALKNEKPYRCFVQDCVTPE